MNRPEIYERSINILREAYRNDVLFHNYCQACAVGNLVKACGGFPFDYAMWRLVFETNYKTGVQYFNAAHYIGASRVEIDQTGYSPIELARIEYAFETVDIKGKINDDQHMLDGLLAVIDVLQDIHGVNQETTEVTKQSFREVKELV